MNFLDKKGYVEDRESSLNRAKKLESLFQIYKLIGEEETLSDLLSRPYPQIKQSIDTFVRYQKGFPESDDGGSKSGSVFFLMILASLSATFWFISTEDTTAVIRANALKIREEINQMAIDEANPYLISFFKWDLDRRKWKREADKLKFLKKTLNELSEELQGQRANLITKYTSLLLHYILFHLDEFLATTSLDILEKLGVNVEESHEAKNKLKMFLEKNRLNEVVDEEMEQMILEYYKPTVQRIEEGLSISSGRFDYLIGAFIEAQFDFRNIVAGMVDALNPQKITSLRSTLVEKNIDGFIAIVRSIFASVPHQLLKSTNEAYYHINLHVMLKAIGCDIQSEISTNKGRIDSVIEFDDLIYVVEYKLDGSESAIEQIERNRYYESYVLSGKRIFALGLSFDNVDRNLRTKYVLKEILQEKMH